MVHLIKIITFAVVFALTFTILPVWDFELDNENSIEVAEINYSEDAVKKILNDPISRGPRLGKVASTRVAAEISDEGMKTAKAMLERAWTENITEADVAEAVVQRMEGLGSSELVGAFAPLIVSGNDTGEPGGHGPDDYDDDENQILPGEVVFIDIGARYNGYVSDITRTFFMGEPNDEQKEIYKILQEAQSAAMDMVKHGVIAGEVDKAARKVIEDYGYGEYFSHCLGHGIGLDVHVPPTICSDTQIPLSKIRDDIITIEPGIYIPDNYGLRIEDDIIVEWTGYEIITYYSREIEDMIIYPPEEPPEKKEPKEKSWWGTESGKRTLTVGGGLVFAAVVASLFLIRGRRKMKAEKEGYSEERIDKSKENLE